MTPTEILKSLEDLEPMPIPCHAASWSREIHDDPLLADRLVELRCSVPMRFEWVHLETIHGLLSLNPEYVAISIRPFDAKYNKLDGTMHDWEWEDWMPQKRAPIAEYFDWLTVRANVLGSHLGDQKVIFLLGSETLRPNPVVDYLLNRVVEILRSVFPDAEFAWAHWGRGDDKYVSRDVCSDFSVAHLYGPPGSMFNDDRLVDAIYAADAFNLATGVDGRKMKRMARVVLGGCYDWWPYRDSGRKRSPFPNAPVQLGQTWSLGKLLANQAHAVTFWPGIGDGRLTDTWKHFRYFVEGMTRIRHPVEE